MKHTLLIDGDIAAFAATSAVEKEVEWENDRWTLTSDLGEARDHFQQQLDFIRSKVNGELDLIVCLSDRERNFRKELDATYKAHRKKVRKPLAYWPFVEWITTEYRTMKKPGLEADDVMGILSTRGTLPHPIIVSGDKDMKQIPGTLIRDGEFIEVTEKEADYWHLYQTLIGDQVDGYKGCPGVGPKKAEEALKASPTWNTVLNFFRKAKLREEDALLQARLARILRASDWDFNKGELVLWTPKRLPAASDAARSKVQIA